METLRDPDHDLRFQAGSIGKEFPQMVMVGAPVLVFNHYAAAISRGCQDVR